MTATHRAVDAGLERDVADRVSAAKLWLVSTESPTTCGDMPYLATALYSLITVATPKVSTMAADRLWRLYVNPTWVQVTDVPVVAATLAHLAWHLLAEHADRGDSLDVHRATADAWETACDVTIADLIDGLPFGLIGAKERGLPEGRSAEEYYALLSGLPVRTDPDSADGQQPSRADEADGDASGAPDPSCGSGCDGQNRDYEIPPDSGQGRVDQSQADQIRGLVAIEFREHQSRIGSKPGEWSRWVESILEPVVPWRSVLASAVRRGVGWVHGQSDYTYTRISRRQAAAPNVVLPATRRPVPEVAIVVDTSGSVDDGLLAQAMGEVNGVLDSMGVAGSSVTVLATDAAVHAVERVHDAGQLHLGGGGGTDMGVGIDAAVQLKPRPSLLIVITDGFTPWPIEAPRVPVVVALLARHRHEMPRTPDWAIRVECVL